MKDEFGRKLINSFPHWEQKHQDKKGKFTKKGLEVIQGIKKWTF